MKLKQLPGDFKVEEIIDIKPLADSGSFKLYTLEKTGIETLSFFGYLGKANKIPVREFGIAGLKDKHAITKQCFTIPSKYSIKTLEEKNFKISFVGYLNNPIRLGDLQGNRFEIIVRDLQKSELDGIRQRAQTVPIVGVPNYFDSQRFGSVVGGEFIAKLLMQKKYEAAVKIFLTSCTKSERASVKNEKRLLLEKWAEIRGFEAQTPSINAVVGEYKRTLSWLSAYKKINSSIREMMISAYQSYLWNECIKRLLQKFVNENKLYPVSYNIGSLIYYKGLTPDEEKSLPLTFKTISEEIKPTALEHEIIEKILSKEEIYLEDFSIKAPTGNFFISHERPVLLRPGDFKITDFSIDEQNDRGRKCIYKVAVSFALPKGSYATVVTKRLFLG